MEGTGAGSGRVDYSDLGDITYSLPGKSFTADNLYTIDLSGVLIKDDRELIKFPVFDFFQRYVVIDYERSTMTIYNYRRAATMHGQ